MKSLLRSPPPSPLALAVFAAAPGVRRQGRRLRRRVDVHDDRSLRRQRHAVAGDGQVVLRRPVRLRQGHEDDSGARRELHRQPRTAWSTRSSSSKGIKFHDGTDFKADAVKVNLDRVTNPDNKLKRYGLYNNNIAKTEVVDDYTARITLKTPFSAFINQLAHPSTVMISPTALAKYGQGHRVRIPVGTGPFKFVEWKQTDYLKVAKFDGYWQKGYRRSTRSPGSRSIDSNARAAVMQTGEAQFTFPVPYEQAETLKAKPELEVVAAPSIVLRYLSMNTQQKPFDNPKVRQAIAYAINKDAAGQGRVQRLRDTGRRRRSARRRIRGQDRRPGRTMSPRRSSFMAEAGYPERFRNRTVVGVQPHASRRRSRRSCSSSCSRSASSTKITLLEAGQRVEKVESWPDPATAPVRLYYVGWSSSTGEADWALRPLLASRIVAAEAVQHGVLQERPRRRRHQGCAGDHRQGGESQVLQGCAGNDLQGRAVGAAGHRKAAVGPQQEADRRLRDARWLVQLHRYRSEVEPPVKRPFAPRTSRCGRACSFSRTLRSSNYRRRMMRRQTAATRCSNTSPNVCWA